MDENLLKTLVNINSHSGNPEGLYASRIVLEEAFDVLGAEKNIENESLIYIKRPLAPTQIFLGGHYDTVYPKDSIFQKFIKKSDEIWTGPGIADMKGGLVILLEALKRFETLPNRDKIGYRIVLNPDEEIGSQTSSPIIEKVAIGCQAAFFFEPSFAGGELVSSRKGSLNLIVKSKGLAAHAGRDLKLGKNAIVPLAELIVHLKDLPGINFGVFQGGHAFNVVPDAAELRINLRSEDDADFKKIFKVVEEFGMDLTWEKYSYRAPKPLTAELEKLIDLLDYPTKALPSGGVCDGNLTASLGIPTVDTLGAVGGKIHTHDEYIESKSLYERSDLFLRFLTRLSNGDISLC